MEEEFWSMHTNACVELGVLVLLLILAHSQISVSSNPGYSMQWGSGQPEIWCEPLLQKNKKQKPAYN